MSELPRPGRPGRGTLDAALARAEQRSLSYPEVGMTGGPAPAGYSVLERSGRLGAGEERFHRAAAALREWRMLDFPWAVLYPDRPAIRSGLTVIVAARTLGLWTLNPTRIVDVVDESDRVGFAYGTVDGHAATGEERFEVSLRPDGTVGYRILAYSRLRHPLARAVPPIARSIQRRFAGATVEAMRRVAGR